MGCGASSHVQGTSPLAAGAEQSAGNQDARTDKPAPIAEDVRTVQDQGPKEVGQPTGAPPAAGGPPASIPDGGSSDSQPVQAFKSPVDDPRPSTLVAGSGDEQSGQDQQQAKLVIASSSFDRRALGTPPLASNSLDPAVTPNSSTATVTLLPEIAAGFVPRTRYTNESDLSMASTQYDLSGAAEDSDDDELAALFTLQAWKRFYSYNKKKPQDLLTYFWRRFPPEEFSCFCISYRNQDLLLTQYMAENCVNGYCARVEDLALADSLFLQLYTLHDYEADQFRIVGLLLVQGGSLPQLLAHLAAFDGFVYHRADTRETAVKQFVSALLVGMSPLHRLQLLSGREIA